jgi:hypothetical protein
MAVTNDRADGVWGTFVSRDRLLQKISLIAMLGGIREGLRQHALTSTPDRGYSLTIEQEAEIACNLAFLSRRRHEPQSVAAIGIEEDEDGQGMVIRLSVNGSMLNGVEEGVKDICRMLEQVSRRRMSPCVGRSRFTNYPQIIILKPKMSNCFCGKLSN